MRLKDSGQLWDGGGGDNEARRCNAARRLRGGKHKNDSHMNDSALLRNSIDSLHVLHVTPHVFLVRAREHHHQHLSPPLHQQSLIT